MKRILCFGDSNTWGYIPGSNCERMQMRWTKVLQSKLGEDYEVIEEGLNSRTLISNDTRAGREGRCSYDYLIPCLDSHDPIDLVVLMLGSNELKPVYNKTSAEIGEAFEKYFIQTILSRKSQFRGTTPQLIIVAIPPVNLTMAGCDEDYKYLEIDTKIKELTKIYKNFAVKYNCGFVDTAKLKLGADGIHLTEKSHNILAEKIYTIINKR